MKYDMSTPSKIVVILGQTATGKSDLALRVAKKYHGEVISADSRQVYRDMNLGTGKISRDFTKSSKLSGNCRTKSFLHQGIPHHLLDVASPRRQFSVSRYYTLATRALKNILNRGALPIVCGGTGLYIDTLLGTMQFPNIPPDYKLRKRLEKYSTKELFEKLKGLDPKRANTIDPHNPRRLVRALEIVMTSGKPVPRLNPSANTYALLKIGIAMPEKILKARIARRLHARIKAGMLQEVKRLHRPGTAGGLSWKRLDTFGLEYRYISRHLRGLITKEGMIQKLQNEIWQYAKRQRSWFKRDKNIHWVSSPREAMQLVADFLK